MVKKRKWLILKKVLSGIILGITYIIPGLCSASMALTLGVYNDMLELFSSFYKPSIIKKHFLFIGGMSIGALLGLFVFTSLYDKIPFVFLSLFIGFILSNLKKEESNKTINFNNFVVILVITLLICLNLVGNIRILSFNENITFMTLLFVFFVGIISSLALILPGISGAMVLFIFGVYDLIVKTLQGIITKQFFSQTLLDENFIVLLVFGVGFLIGIIAFSKIIDKFISKNKPLFLSITKGFLLGSVVILSIDLFKSVGFSLYLVLSFLLVLTGYFIGKRTLKKW